MLSLVLNNKFDKGGAGRQTDRKIGREIMAQDPDGSKTICSHFALEYNK